MDHKYYYYNYKYINILMVYLSQHLFKLIFISIFILILKLIFILDLTIES